MLDRAGVRAVDRAAVEEFGVPGIVLMENAARALAVEALDLLASARRRGDACALIVCGPGNNGGDGWALARHLRNAGVEVIVTATGEPREGTDAAINRTICTRIGITELAPTGLEVGIDVVLEGGPRVDLVVDALFGTGLDRPVDGAACTLIDWINRCGRPVLAVDVPSGMDCDTGASLGTVVCATRTVTFVGWKPGFLELAAQPALGEVVVADIGAPRELAARYGRRLAGPPADPDRRDVPAPGGGPGVA